MPFVPPSPELPEAKDNKHAIKIRINEETDEHISVLHGGIPETYLQYTKICEDVLQEKDLYAAFDWYAKEETLASNNLNILELSNRDANDPTEELEETERIKRKSHASTPLQRWLNTRKSARTGSTIPERC